LSLADTATMIDRLGPARSMWASLGGSMALALAQRHPGKLKSLMVVAASGDRS
jgi:pimeloyl-ACP methyl ester carboxylesterase